VRKPILHEGEREGPVEVITIDFDKSTVLIRNGTVETNLNFEVPKAASAAPAGGAAPARGLGVAPLLPTANAGANPPAPKTASQEPNIISKTPFGTPIDRSGIGLYGATPSSVGAATAVGTARTGYTGAGYVNAGYAGGPIYSGGNYNPGYNSGAAINTGVNVSPGASTGTGLASANTSVGEGSAPVNSGISTTRPIRSGASDGNALADMIVGHAQYQNAIDTIAKNPKGYPAPPALPAPWDSGH